MKIDKLNFFDKCLKNSKALSVAFLILLSGVVGFGKEKFKIMHTQDLATFLKSSPKAKGFLFDANTESTRKKEGLIVGAIPLSSAVNYDVKEELPSDKKSKLIFYCTNEFCTASHSAAQRALEAGYLDVTVMADGIEGWRLAGMPSTPYDEKLKTASTPASSVVPIEPKAAYALLQKGEAIIVDVREAKERVQVIESALSLPMSDFQDRQKRTEFFKKIPSHKKIIFHCAAGFRSLSAAKTLVEEGFQSSYFEGPNQWMAAGLPVVKGPASK